MTGKVNSINYLVTMASESHGIYWAASKHVVHGVDVLKAEKNGTAVCCVWAHTQQTHVHSRKHLQWAREHQNWTTEK